ncbi:hypothetical protein B296_00006698 [Ensete ventricosum]|uniref:Uncharacterized protein n=1 Tax=Ensete ventricosum TaxID=4639 RepID=A0A427A754_ENSVE|nr:hypothetical protein B296_00006698 [Ensete ventricosum]
MRAPLVAIEDSTVSDLYVKLVATFNLKHYMCSNLAVKEVICATRIDENGDGLLFKKSSNFHHLWVGVAGQRVCCVVGQLGLFLCGFIFSFSLLRFLRARWSIHAEFAEKGSHLLLYATFKGFELGVDSLL